MATCCCRNLICPAVHALSYFKLEKVNTPHCLHDRVQEWLVKDVLLLVSVDYMHHKQVDLATLLSSASHWWRHLCVSGPWQRRRLPPRGGTWCGKVCKEWTQTFFWKSPNEHQILIKFKNRNTTCKWTSKYRYILLRKIKTMHILPATVFDSLDTGFRSKLRRKEAACLFHD